jgi:hypothetical protein
MDEEPVSPSRSDEGRVRAAGWESFVETLWQDLRFAARMLRKNPGVNSVVVLTLALGIGTCSSVFSLINSVLIRSLPYRDPQRLVHEGICDYFQ